MFFGMKGDAENEPKLIREISPLFHADKISAPLRVVWGANDIRCKKTEADQIVRALSEPGINVPFMVKEHEENRSDVYRAREHLLAQHLGRRVEERTVMPEMNGVVDEPVAGEKEAA